ncbi:MAG: putative Ig domain-containing protein [Candidatus Zixiibacteriota bacterium]|nr:MAG: putative Ig domain-containing protein [candidate division Zixibacteria bacterium]
MRNFTKSAVILFVLTVTSFSVGFGQYYEPAVYVDVYEIEGLSGGHIPMGATITIPVRFKNIDEPRTAISNGYKFTAVDGEVTWADLTGQWNPAYPWDWPHAIELGVFPPFFDQILWINEFDDTIGFAGLKGQYGSGLPADFDDIAYYITLTDVGGEFYSLLRMDSSFWEPANYWLWSGVAENVYWGGPYDFWLIPPIPASPTITSTPVTSATIFHLYTYQVESSGYPAPTYSLTTAPPGMTVNPTTGLIQWIPDAMAVSVPVTVVATNSLGSDAQSFTIDVGGFAPTFTSTPVTSGNVDEPYSYDADADGYPEPTYALTTSPTGMTIDAVTGLIEWTPDAEGSFAVVVEASNSEGTTPQSFSISVGPPIEPVVYVNVNEIQGLTEDGKIPDGGTITIPIRYFNEDAARMSIRNHFEIIAEEVTWFGISAEWNPNYPWDWEHAVELGIFPPYFDVLTSINYYENQVSLVGLAGAGGSGLPADFDDIACYITISDISGPDGATLALDSILCIPPCTEPSFWGWDPSPTPIPRWDGPYELVIENIPPYTTCWPQPTVIKALENDRILNVSVHREENDRVILESMRVQGKLPPYTEARIDGDSIVTDCFIMRFLGVSGFRPIQPEGVQDHYTVEYDKLDGTHVILTGDFVIAIYQGDVNLDGQVNMDDVIFMSDYLFSDGRMCEIEEFMDIDANGTLDIKDMNALIDLVSE